MNVMQFKNASRPYKQKQQGFEEIKYNTIAKVSSMSNTCSVRSNQSNNRDTS